MNEQQVVKLMQSSKSEAKWATNEKRVMRAFGGNHPEFWHRAIVQPGIATKTVGPPEIKAVILNIRSVDIHGRPTSMPHLAKGEIVVAIYSKGLGRKKMVCNSLANMQSLYDSYAQGVVISLHWFIFQQFQKVFVPTV